jgi:hypothetical protein
MKSLILEGCALKLAVNKLPEVPENKKVCNPTLLSSDGASREWLIESRERLEDINKASSSNLRLVTNKKQVIIEIESREK